MARLRPLWASESDSESAGGLPSLCLAFCASWSSDHSEGTFFFLRLFRIPSRRLRADSDSVDLQVSTSSTLRMAFGTLSNTVDGSREKQVDAIAIQSRDQRTGARRKPRKCLHCGKEYPITSFLSVLQNHQKYCKLNPARRPENVCAVCQRAFRDPYSLLRHIAQSKLHKTNLQSPFSVLLSVAAIDDAASESSTAHMSTSAATSVPTTPVMSANQAEQWSDDSVGSVPAT